MGPVEIQERQRRPVPVLPRQALWFIVVGPPVQILLFSAPATAWQHPDWTPWEPLRSLLAAVFYTAVLVLSIYGTFNLVLARWAALRRSTIASVLAYGVTIAALVVPLTYALRPAIAAVAPGMVRQPATLTVQGVVVAYLWVGATRATVRFLERIGEERRRAYHEQLVALDARVRLLQARTDPHFLFNSLNSVMSLIATDPALAEETLGRLATLFRYALEGSGRHLVSLDDDLAALGDYLGVEAVRFGERLRYEIDVAPDARRAAVPPMMLQPLVENAVKHGVARRAAGGRIVVRGALRGPDLLLEVSDDGPGPRGSSHHGTGTSLVNLRERLRLLYDDDRRLVTGPGEGGVGFRSTLRLPTGWDE